MVAKLFQSTKTAVAIAALTLSTAASAQVVLPKYNVSFDNVSVSGLSSGGYMAAQFHFAYSKTVKKGAGVMAGGPVYCSQGSATKATGPCTEDSGSRELPKLISIVNDWSATGKIDPTVNLATSKVYLYSGTLDSTVRQPVMDDLHTMYLNYMNSANVVYKNDLAAEHAMPTDYYGNECSHNGTPFINNCNFDAAGQTLNWIYGTLNAKNTGTLGGSFINFDQKAYWGNGDPTKHGMSDSGWAYVPANCAAGQSCKLHVVFHGCKQNVATIGSKFYENTGYNKWADSNNIIVLYPQAYKTLANPNGCWDWWAYDDKGFAEKRGGQMIAIKTMIDRVVSGNAAAPYTCSQVYDSNANHVKAGRAYASGTSAYATNSNQYLGSNSTRTKTNVRQTSAGYYAYGKCPV
jgi:poly(3-hydroxybutyrate) depolymerase